MGLAWFEPPIWQKLNLKNLIRLYVTFNRQILKIFSTQATQKVLGVLESSCQGELWLWVRFDLNHSLRIRKKLNMENKISSYVTFNRGNLKIFYAQATPKILHTLKSNGHGELCHWVWFDLNHSLAIWRKLYLKNITRLYVSFNRRNLNFFLRKLHLLVVQVSNFHRELWLWVWFDLNHYLTF